MSYSEEIIISYDETEWDINGTFFILNFDPCSKIKNLIHKINIPPLINSYTRVFVYIKIEIILNDSLPNKEYHTIFPNLLINLFFSFNNRRKNELEFQKEYIWLR